MVCGERSGALPNLFVGRADVVPHAPGDVYYGQEPNKGPFRFHHPSRAEDAKWKEAAYFFTAVTVEGPKVTLRLLDAAEGEEWDRAVLAGESASQPAASRPATRAAGATHGRPT